MTIIDPVAEFRIQRDPAELLLNPTIRSSEQPGGELDLRVDCLGHDGREIESARAEVDEDLWRYVMETV